MNEVDLASNTYHITVITVGLIIAIVAYIWPEANFVGVGLGMIVGTLIGHLFGGYYRRWRWSRQEKRFEDYRKSKKGPLGKQGEHGVK